MSGINQHTILGNVGNIETKYAANGNAIVNMSLAVSEKWKDKNTGQMSEKTEWLRVVVFGKPAEIISQYVNKGDKLYVQGKIVTRKWQDQSGQDRYSTETVVDGFNGKFELLGGKGGQPEKGSVNQGNQQQNRQPQQQQPQQQNNDFDDDIPFR